MVFIGHRKLRPLHNRVYVRTVEVGTVLALEDVNDHATGPKSAPVVESNQTRQVISATLAEHPTRHGFTRYISSLLAFPE